MAKITAKDVTSLKEQTGVGIMDCKKALVEADGDVEKAITLLREKGLATQAKKAGRVAAEGICTAVVNGSAGAVVEVNIETDFAANNDEFKAYVANVADTIIKETPADIEALKQCKISGSDKTVDEVHQALFMKVRENMVIRRFERLDGILVPYVHGEGKIAVMVKLDTDIPADNAELQDCGKNVAMQVAAMNPPYLNRNDVPESIIANEREIVLAQMAEDPKMAGKPDQIKHKIADGKLGRYYSENCLLEQSYVKDDKLTVGAYVAEVAKKLGGKIEVVEFVRFERGAMSANEETEDAE